MFPIVNHKPLSSPPLQQAGAWPAEDATKEAAEEVTGGCTKHSTPKDSLGNTQVFQGGELDRLFKTIDQLRECGVSEDISLPQVSTPPPPPQTVAVACVLTVRSPARGGRRPIERKILCSRGEFPPRRRRGVASWRC